MNLDPETVDYIVTLITAWGLSVLGALAILVIGWALSRWAEGTTRRALGRTSRIDRTLTSFLSSLVRYLVLIFTVTASSAFRPRA